MTNEPWYSTDLPWYSVLALWLALSLCERILVRVWRVWRQTRIEGTAS